MPIKKEYNKKHSLTQSNLGISALFLGASATALSPIFVRLSDLAPVASAFHRMAWALPIIWVWTLYQKRTQIHEAIATSPHDRKLLTLCGCFFAGDLIALHWSIELTTIANAILFLNAQPIYVIFGTWIL
jgi:drug/metabolite transporter (DMT)-like permease